MEERSEASLDRVEKALTSLQVQTYNVHRKIFSLRSSVKCYPQYQHVFPLKKIDIFFLLFQIIAHIHCAFFNCSSATLTKKRKVNLGLG